MKGQKAIFSFYKEVSDHFFPYLRFASMRSNKLVKSEEKMQSLIAKALQTDLNTSVQISMKAVSFNFKFAVIYLLNDLQ